jgi:hypothetical protein
VLGFLEAGLGKGRTMTEDKNMENLQWANWFEQMFAEMDTPEWKLRFEQRNQFEREVLYAGLTELNTGFDSPQAGHFSPVDFLTVIERCESLSVRVIGIEVFTTDVEPPSKVQMVDIEISPEEGYDWSRRLVREYMEESASLSLRPSTCPMNFSSRTQSRKVSQANEKR